MRKIILALILVAVSAISSRAQHFIPTKTFATVIVKDMAKSEPWYRKLFEVTLVNEINEPNAKVRIFESKYLAIELLELKDAMPRPGERTQGHFKIGYSVQDMDKLLGYLKDEGIKVDRIWTDQKTGKRNFLINDPDGNLIQFFE